MQAVTKAAIVHFISFFFLFSAEAISEVEPTEISKFKFINL